MFFRALIKDFKDSSLQMHLANDGVVYKDQVKNLFLGREDQEDTTTGHCEKGVLIVIPLRLGIEKLNPIYHPALKVLVRGSI